MILKFYAWTLPVPFGGVEFLNYVTKALLVKDNATIAFLSNKYAREVME